VLLGWLERPTPAVLAALRRFVSHPDLGYWAGRAIARLGAAAVEALPEVTAAAQTGEVWAVNTLVALGERGVEAIAALLGQDLQVSGRVLRALAGVGPAASPALPHLLPLLSRAEAPQLDWYRDSVFAAIGAMGPAAAAVVPDLLARLNGRDGHRAAAALEKIRPEHQKATR
jgi:hypothetical protein